MLGLFLTTTVEILTL